MIKTDKLIPVLAADHSDSLLLIRLNGFLFISA